MINVEYFASDIQTQVRELLNSQSEGDINAKGDALFQRLFDEYPGYMHDNYLSSELLIDINTSSYFDREAFIKKHPELTSNTTYPKKKVSKFVVKNSHQEALQEDLPLLVTYELYDNDVSHLLAVMFENSDTPFKDMTFTSYLGEFDSPKQLAKWLASEGKYIIHF